MVQSQAARHTEAKSSELEDAMTTPAPSTLTDPTVLTLSEFAKRVGATPPTIRLWISKGEIVATKTPGGHYRIPVSQLTERDLSLSQFARLIGIHRVTARRWCEAVPPRVACRKNPSGYWRISMSEVPRIGVRKRTPLQKPVSKPISKTKSAPENQTGATPSPSTKEVR